MQNLIVAAGRLVPQGLRQTIIGDGAQPSWISTTIHSLINYLSSDKFPIVSCGAALKGYRMKLEWARYRAFAYGSWEPQLVELVSRNVKRGFTAVDIGAHIGYYSLLLSRLVGPTGRVFSFEPVPSNFDFLMTNLNLNNCINVDAVNRAVLDRRHSIRIQIQERDPLPVAISFANPENKGDVIVESVSLDEFLLGRTEKVDFLKVDAESAEEQVIEGGRKLIERDHPLIMMEVHHFNSRLEDSPVPAKLCGMNYRLEQIDHGPLVSHFWAR